MSARPLACRRRSASPSLPWGGADRTATTSAAPFPAAIPSSSCATAACARRTTTTRGLPASSGRSVSPFPRSSAMIRSAGSSSWRTSGMRTSSPSATPPPSSAATSTRRPCGSPPCCTHSRRSASRAGLRLMPGFGPELYRWEQDYFREQCVGKVCGIALYRGRGGGPGERACGPYPAPDGDPVGPRPPGPPVAERDGPKRRAVPHRLPGDAPREPLLRPRVAPLRSVCRNPGGRSHCTPEILLRSDPAALRLGGVPGALPLAARRSA